MVETWHRIVFHRCAPPLDEFDNPVGRGTVEAYCMGFSVIKTTPKGVWLNDCGRKRFVLKDARKRFACPTVDEAFTSFEARTKRRVNILSAQIDDCVAGIETARRNVKYWNEIEKKHAEKP